MTSKQEIKDWLTLGKKMGATHTIIFCDTWDYEDYPVHVMPGQDPWQVAKESQDRLMEVYSHALEHDSQLAEDRAYHWEMPVINAKGKIPNEKPDWRSTVYLPPGLEDE